MHTWSLEQPFVTSNTANVIVVSVIENSSETESGVSFDNGQRLDRNLEDFTWIERERVLGKANVLVGMAKLHLTALVHDNGFVGVAEYGVFHNAVMAWGHRDHLFRAEHHLLIVLADEGARTHFDTSDIGVLVQHVKVVERGNAVQAPWLIATTTTTTATADWARHFGNEYRAANL